ncbi:MAG: flagellar biosynthesis protein FlhF, partial [Colwelliaceae bacterium]|nr:flagellar biosynthesis protein FlhF [Colwelliaceae bacterium]
MKIKRYVAKDMRTALAQIKEELGADAVIMSNKKIPEGVELMAAVDYSTQAPSAQQEAPSAAATSASSEAELRDDVVRLSSGSSASAASQSIGQAMPSAEATTPADSPADSLAALLSRNVQQTQNPAETDVSHASETPDLEAQLKQFTQKLASQSSGVSQTETSSAAHSVEDNESELDGFETQAPSSFKQPELVNSAQTQQASLGDTPSQTGAVSIEAFEQMKSEMASIRQLLEHQVSGLMWQDLAQKEPSRAMLIDRLQAMGITEELADQIAGYVPTNLPADEAWEAALTLLSHQINTTNNDIIHRGGIVSLVGPTGVGKTTTLAKLAARFAQVHGADELALISTDTYRIGGFEQLETY